jgi:hypothetical protein
MANPGRRQGQTSNFTVVGVRHRSAADPATDFGQVVAAALDRPMTASGRVASTSDKADPVLCDACLEV